MGIRRGHWEPDWGSLEVRMGIVGDLLGVHFEFGGESLMGEIHDLY